MRRRVLAATLAAATLAVVLLGVPLAVAVRSLLTNQALDALQREAEQAQVLLARQAAAGVDPALLLPLLAERTGARLVLLDAGTQGVTVLDTGAPPPLPPRPADLNAALDGSVGRVVSGGVVAVSVPVRGPGVSQVLRVLRSDATLTAAVQRSWLALVGLALTALAAAAFVGTRQSRRLAAPLEALAEAARRLGDGDFSARAPRTGLSEPDAVAGALEATARRLGATLERSRSFGADASHQLRTPLTALRLHLEALAVVEPQLAGRALAEADRLEATIDELLALAAAPAGDELVDLGALVAERLGAWQSLARAEHRAVILQRGDVPPVRARPAALGQVLHVLLDNALVHGRGTITVTVQTVGQGHGVRLCVTDEGPGVAPDAVENLLSGDAGQGLTLARGLLEAEGGRLHYEDARPGARWCVVLPAVTAEVRQ